MATAEGREVLSFIVSCALPADAALVATLPDGEPFEFYGEIGLANEWLGHPLRKAGRGWVSACLFARVNNHNVTSPLSMRGQTQALATTPEEAATWTLEEKGWRKRKSLLPDQPAEGFTIAASEPEESVALLRKTYENGDDEARRLTRLLAELSVATVRS